MKKLLFLLFFFMPLIGFSQTWDDIINEAFGYYQKGKYKSAIETYNKALKEAKTVYGEQSKEYALTLHSIGHVYTQAGMYDKAETYLLAALEMREKVLGKESKDYATTLNNLGTVYIYMGDYIVAEKYLLESGAIRKRLLGDADPDYASSLNNIAYLYQMMNRFEDAEKAFLESLRIYEEKEGKQSENYAQELNNLGYLYQETGRLSESEKFYVEALKIRKELFGTNHPDYALNLSNLGVLYSELGLYEKAIANLEEAKVTIGKILGNTHPDYALIINNLAVSYSGINNYIKAEEYYKESIEINRTTVGEKNPYYAVGLGNLALLYKNTKRYADAIPLAKQSVSILESTVGNMNPRYADALVNLAGLYHSSGLYESADSNYSKALAIREAVFDPNHKDIAALKNSMAGLYWTLNDYERAKKYFIEGIHIIAFQIEQQSDYLSEMEMSKFLHDNGYYAKSFYSFCNSYYKTDPSLIGEMNQFYSLINGKLLKNANQLKNELASSKDTTVILQYNQWQALKKSINDQMALPEKYRNQYIGNWEQQSIQLEKDLIRTSTTFKNEIESTEKSWKEIRSNLKPGEAIVEFISFNLYNGRNWVDSILYSAMIIRPQDSIPVYVPLFEESRLEGLFLGDTLRTFANLLYTEAQIRTIEDHDISYGDSLYKLIWEPLELYLKDIHHIYYAPSALLHNIAHDAIPAADSKLLSDKFQLDRISSTDNILKTNTNHFQMSSIAMFGGIQYELDVSLIKDNTNNKKVDNIFYSSKSALDESTSRGGSWTYLPGAKKEVESISGILKNHKVKVSVYSDTGGKEEIVKSFDGKNSPSVFHFSTHGFFFSDPNKDDSKTNEANAFTTADNPLFRSGLIFAGANYVWKGNQPIEGVEDGILTAYEVSNLYLPNTQLVVMSACETGLGDIKRSEGVYGLQRAFKMTGVEYIIVTLWQVLDKETSDFMILFYQNLIEKKSVPAAFKLTQDVMKNKYRDEPYKWAGFVLIK